MNECRDGLLHERINRSSPRRDEPERWARFARTNSPIHRDTNDPERSRGLARTHWQVVRDFARTNSSRPIEASPNPDRVLHKRIPAWLYAMNEPDLMCGVQGVRRTPWPAFMPNFTNEFRRSRFGHKRTHAQPGFCHERFLGWREWAGRMPVLGNGDPKVHERFQPGFEGMDCSANHPAIFSQTDYPPLPHGVLGR